MSLKPQDVVSTGALREDDDHLIDRLIEDHPGFKSLLERRLRERTVHVDAASTGSQRSEHRDAGSAAASDAGAVFDGRLRVLSQPQFRLRVGDVKVFYNVTIKTVKILAIVTKAKAARGLPNMERPRRQVALAEVKDDL